MCATITHNKLLEWALDDIYCCKQWRRVHSSKGGIIHPPFAYPPLFFKIVLSPDKQYLKIFKNFAFHSSVNAVENVTVKEILISV